MTRCYSLCVILEQGAGGRGCSLRRTEVVSAGRLNRGPFLPHSMCWEGANDSLNRQLFPRGGDSKILVGEDCGPNQAKRNRLGQGSVVTAWQKRQTQGPMGKRAFFAPQRHCRTSVTLETLLKGEKNEQNPGRTFQLHSTQIRVQSSSAGKGREASSPKAALSLALPPLLPDSFWQPDRFQPRTYRPQKDQGSLSGGPRWEGHFSKYKYI